MPFRTVQVEKVPPSFQHEQRGYQTRSSRRHSDVGETACRRPAGKGWPRGRHAGASSRSFLQLFLESFDIFLKAVARMRHAKEAKASMSIRV